LSLFAQFVVAMLAYWAISLTPFSALIASEAAYLEDHSLWFVSIELTSDLTFWAVSPWVVYVIITLLFSLLMLWLSVRRVGRMEK
jgi:hypothetical protein